MSVKDNQPHVEFVMSLNPVATALDALGVGDAGLRQQVAAGKSWPLPAAWEPYVLVRHLAMIAPPAADANATLEAKLGDLEQRFDAWLQTEHDKGGGDLAVLRQLAEEVAALEKLITTGGSHATFPYFSRFFLLEAMIFAKRMEHGDTTGADQMAKVHLWWRSRLYLQQAFQSAYAERVGQIVTRQTGARKDRVFVEDARTREPLTIDVVAGGQDEIELRRVREYLASRAAWRYIQDLGIEEGAVVLSHAHATITVTDNSRYRQQDLVDPSLFWQEQQASIEAEIERNRAACGQALERLVLPAMIVAAVSDLGELERDPPEYWGYLETVIPGVIGMIPVVGSAASLVWSVYLKLLGGVLYPDTPDPLIEFEKKMEALIFDSIAVADANNINNYLKGYEDELRLLLPAFDTPNPSNASKTKAIALCQKILLDKHHFLEPASGSYYKTAPYFSRYFICLLTAAELAQKSGDDRDFPLLRKTLYQETDRLVYNAVHGMCGERTSRIRIMDTSNGCSSNIKEVNDYRVNKKFSSDLRTYHQVYQDYALNACQWAAGMATAIQFMREMTQQINAMVVRDTAVVNTTPSGFKPNTIGDTYYNAIWYLQGQCWSTYELLRRAGLQNIVHADVGKMNNAAAAQIQLPETQFPGDTIFKL